MQPPLLRHQSPEGDGAHMRCLCITCTVHENDPLDGQQLIAILVLIRDLMGCIQGFLLRGGLLEETVIGPNERKRVRMLE
jgi:hypothetical protein